MLMYGKQFRIGDKVQSRLKKEAMGRRRILEQVKIDWQRKTVKQIYILFVVKVDRGKNLLKWNFPPMEYGRSVGGFQ